MLLAIQDSALAGNHKLPISNLTAVGAQDAGKVAPQTSHAVIGYKGQQVMAWKDELRKDSGQGPAELSSSIPISCSYVPEGDTAKSVMSPFYLYVTFFSLHPPPPRPPRQDLNGSLRGVLFRCYCLHHHVWFPLTVLFFWLFRSVFPPLQNPTLLNSNVV